MHEENSAAQPNIYRQFIEGEPFMPASPKFCIFGAGAIGGTIAALFVRCGARVSMVAQGETAAALTHKGIRLMIDGKMLQAPVQVSEGPSTLW